MYKKQVDDKETNSTSIITQIDGINLHPKRIQHSNRSQPGRWIQSGSAAMDADHPSTRKWQPHSVGSPEEESDASDCAETGPARSAGCTQLKPLSHQVAGHVDGKNKGLGMRQHPDGSVLKHLQPPPRGQREVDFYKTVFDAECKDEKILFLRDQVPRFMGTWIPPNSPNTVYLKLEDVTCTFSKPSIMDVKMGRQSYDPCASQEKVAYERSKYPFLQEIGFLILGMRVYQPETDTDLVYDKLFGRSLKPENLKEGISKFFHNGHCLRLDALECVIQRLENIYTWFQQQRIWNFYSSSLLMVYEGNAHLQMGHATRTTSPATCCLCRQVTEPHTKDVHKDYTRTASTVRTARQHVDVKLIDFAHAFLSNEADEGYIYGLNNLIAVLREILEKVGY